MAKFKRKLVIKTRHLLVVRILEEGEEEGEGEREREREREREIGFKQEMNCQRYAV